MKKIITIILAIAIILPVTTVAQNAALETALKKEYKQKMKEYKKEGWKIYGSSRTLEVALLTHYEELNKLGALGYEIVGVCSRYKSDNIGHQTTVNNACNIYARNAGSIVRGRIQSEMLGNGSNTAEEFDRFYASYESLVEKEIRGELKESFSIYRELANGDKAMQTYFIVNEEAAVKARIRALERAFGENEEIQRYTEAGQVGEYVRKVVN